MKTTSIILVFLFVVTNYGIAQKVKYGKEIKPLLEQGKISEALPLLVSYYNQNIVNGSWTNKAILLEMENMNAASELVANYYNQKASELQSIDFADSAIYWFNRMIVDEHSNMQNASNNIETLKKQKLIWKAQKEKNAREEHQRKVNDSIQELRAAEKKEREEFQKKMLENYSGEDSPLIAAKVYANYFISANIDKLIEVGYKDERNGNVGELRAKFIKAYMSGDKVEIQKQYNDARNEQYRNLHITEDEEKIKVFFKDEKTAVIENYLTYNPTPESCKKSGQPVDCFYRGKVTLVYINDTWKVKDIHF